MGEGSGLRVQGTRGHQGFRGVIGEGSGLRVQGTRGRLLVQGGPGCSHDKALGKGTGLSAEGTGLRAEGTGLRAEGRGLRAEGRGVYGQSRPSARMGGGGVRSP